MFSVRSVLVMMLVGGATSAMAAQPRESMSVVSIRVHDYAQTDRRHLQQAEREVSRIYERIGVRLDWREPLRPAELEAANAPWPRDVAMVTLVVVHAAAAFYPPNLWRDGPMKSKAQIQDALRGVIDRAIDTGVFVSPEPRR